MVLSKNLSTDCESVRFGSMKLGFPSTSSDQQISQIINNSKYSFLSSRCLCNKMNKFINICLLFCGVQCLLAVDEANFQEKYRLQLHYSVPSGWSNDPNGLIFANGVYHLYYQHNPDDAIFGPMHWGHAQSTDLIHWETLPIAIHPYEKGVIFSGSCVLDATNVTGITESTDEIPIIAIYTINGEHNAQSQGMAYSLDKGRSFTQYSGNPILPNQGIADFRDPYIFKRKEKFYMIVAANDRVQFFSSKDLLSWKYLSDFGVKPKEGDKSGVWECPSLVTLYDEYGHMHDVLMLSLNNDDLRTGQMQYFIGHFDGTAFNSFNKSRVLRVDNGFDYYASIPYYNDPLGRQISIGWMSNWLYAGKIPTSKWRGQMTIPRELTLKSIDDYYLTQRPIDTLNNLIDGTRNWSLTTPVEISGKQNIDLTPQIPFKTGSMLILDYMADIQNAANGSVGLQFGNKLDEYCSFVYSIDSGIYELDRSKSGDVSFSPKFADRVAQAKRISKSNVLTGRIILDTASIEIFADDGLNTFSALFFPTEPYDQIQLNVALEDTDLTRSVTVHKFSVAALNSIWQK